MADAAQQMLDPEAQASTAAAMVASVQQRGIGGTAGLVWNGIKHDYTDLFTSSDPEKKGRSAAAIGLAVVGGVAAAFGQEEVPAEDLMVEVDANAARIEAEAADAAATRVPLRVATKKAIQDAAPKTPEGDFIDPNTGNVIPRDGPFDYGHKPGFDCGARRPRRARRAGTAHG